MKKFIVPIVILIIIAIAAATVFLIPSVRHKIFGIKLEYKFNPGETASYKTNMNMEFQLPMPNIIPMAAKKGDITTALNMDSSFNREITQVKDGNATVATTVRIEKLNLSLNGKDISPEIPAGFEKKIVFTATPQGKILDPGNEANSQDEKAEGFSASYIFFQGWISLPEKAIRPGDQWKGETDTAIGGKSLTFRLKGPVNYKFDGMTVYKGVKCAQINFDGEYKTESQIKAKGIEMDMSATAKLTGKAYFDLKNGRVMLLTRDINIDISKKIPFPNVTLSGKAKYQIRTEIEE